MKATDLLCQILKEFGVTHVFGVTGGSILHPLESAHKIGFAITYTHHEQAASFAADAATRITNQPQACFITTGPAGTNAMTGVLTSWLDSVPQIIISGQSRLADLTSRNSVRQIGTQHYDIISSIDNITNANIQLKSKETYCTDIVNTLTKAIEGRPGPVWIDIPLDLQWADINLTSFKINSAKNIQINTNSSFSSDNIKEDEEKNRKIEAVMKKLVNAKRPMVIIGAGCKSNNVGFELVKVMRDLSIPMAFTWGSIDLSDSSHDNNLGIIGINGQRSANLCAYLSDVLIGFGTHLSDQITGRDKHMFAPNAYKCIIDIDTQECERALAFTDVIECDLRNHRNIISNFSTKLISQRKPNINNIVKIKKLQDYDLSLDKDEDYVSILRFYSMLFQHSMKQSIFVADGGGNTFFSSLQNIKIKRGIFQL